MKFAHFFIDRPVFASVISIVFVIIGAWKGQASLLSLPFFSQVNLRQRAEDLQAMGFRVACACIPPMGGRRVSGVVTPLARRTVGL